MLSKNTEALKSYIECLTELYDEGEEETEELILSELEKLIELVKEKNWTSWDN